MNEMQVYSHPDFGSVRAVMIDGEPWFVGRDAASVLGYSNPSKGVLDHVDNDDRKTEVLPYSQNGKTVGKLTIINESGLYSLILSSRLPQAKQFKKWVTGEVLPAIRKHGVYMTRETLEAAVLDPDVLIRVCQQLKAEREKNRRLADRNGELEPKGAYFDALCDARLLTSFRDTAKEFGVGQNQLISFLLDKKFVYRDEKGCLMPYSSQIKKGLFRVKERYNAATKWWGVQTMITPEGRDALRKRISEFA